MKVGVQFGFGNVTPVSDQDVDRPALDKSSCLMVSFAPDMVARICSTAASHLLCELFGSMAGVLERNISLVYARDFKARAMAKIGALAQLVARHLPWLPPEFTAFFAEGALTLTAGMYPFSVPTEPVRVAIAEIGYPDPAQRFSEGLRAGLVTWLIGAAAQTEA